jgi:RimJ/RimL family protein N-acetyltransferase
MERKNELGQPIGKAVQDWSGAHSPAREMIQGARCRLEPLDAARHASALHAAYRENLDGSNWTYLPYGPFESEAMYTAWAAAHEETTEGVFFAIVDLVRETPVGVASYLRIAPDAGSIEVGHLSYAPVLQRTPASTEAMYLMMKRVFEDWGYRRYEWKCDSHNAPSRAAAARLGFRYEGVFRNQLVMKDRNRDTAWFSITNEEWPKIRSAFEAWLQPSNFEADGAQIRSLSEGMPETAGKPIVAML